MATRLARCFAAAVLSVSLASCRPSGAAAGAPIAIVVECPGAAAEDVESSVTAVLETALARLPHVERIESVSRRGDCRITLTPARGADTGALRKSVERLRVALPDDAMMSLQPPVAEALSYTLEAEAATAVAIRSLHDQEIRPQLLTIPGIADVTACGAAIRQIEVVIDPERLASTGVELSQVVRAVEAVRRLPEEIASAVVAQRDGVPVLVKDVAVVADGARRAGSATRDGRPVVAGTVRIGAGADRREVARGVRERLDSIRKKLPAGMDVRPFAFADGKDDAPPLRLRLGLSAEPAKVAQALERTPEIGSVLIRQEVGEAPDVLVELRTKIARPADSVAREISGNLRGMALWHDMSSPAAEIPATSLSLLVLGADLDRLCDAARTVMNALAALPGTAALDAAGMAREAGISAVVDREAVAHRGIRSEDVALALRAVRGGVRLRSAREVDVVVYLGLGPDPEAERLRRIRIGGAALSELVSLRNAERPVAILRCNGRRAVEVRINADGRDLEAWMQRARARLSELKLGDCAVEWK